MAVRIPSDLVMDVMRAADPARVAAASRKLQSTQVASASFDRAMADVAPSQQEKPAVAQHDAYSQFESFMLRDAFETMLPKPEESGSNDAFAGSVWRSMAADQYASIFTERGGLGIAEMLRSRAAGSSIAPSNDGQWPYFKMKSPT